MIIKSVYFGNKHPHENTQPTVTYTIENLKKNVLPLISRLQLHFEKEI